MRTITHEAVEAAMDAAFAVVMARHGLRFAEQEHLSKPSQVRDIYIRLSALQARGYTAYEASQDTGMAYQNVLLWARREGLKFRRPDRAQRGGAKSE